MEHIFQLTKLIANSQLLIKPFIESFVINVLIWMIVVIWMIFFEFLATSFLHTVIILIWTKNLVNKETICFLIQSICGSIIIIGKNCLIDNLEAYSEPSLIFTMELFANIFNSKKLFLGVPWTLVLIKSNMKITTTGKLSFLQNSLNLIFEKWLNILCKSLKKYVQDFLAKISSFENESGVN